MFFFDKLINFFPFLSEVCNILHIRYLCWIVDSPVMELYSTSLLNPYNRIFLFDKELFREFSPKNPSCIFYLPLGARVQDKELLFQKKGTAHEKFAHELSFVGSLYTEKDPYSRLSGISENTRGFLDGIMKAQEMVYGYFFIEELLSDPVVHEFKAHFPGFFSYPGDSFLTDRITLSQLYMGTHIAAMERMDTFAFLSSRFPVSLYTGSDTTALPLVHNQGLAKTLEEMPFIFHNSKINLNITAKSIRSALPLRIFDILSCGGFVISNYQPEIPELFSVGEDLLLYSSLEELSDQISYFLSHDSERIAIAEHGYQTLKENYSYEIQLAKLMEAAFQ